MPKLNTLLNHQLKELLRMNNLETAGVKAELVARLIEHFGSDEIDQETLTTILPQPSTNMQAEINAMSEMMRSLSQTVQQLSEQMKIVTARNTNATVHDEIDLTANNTDAMGVEQSDNISVASSQVHYERVDLQHNFSVREIAETIPEYDPTKESALSAEQFIQHIEGAMGAYEWNDKCVLLAVYSRLRGVARMWFDCRDSPFSNWCDFKQELLKEFGSTLDEAEINFKMSNAIRKADENVIDYCFRIHALGRRCNLSESAIIRYAREGINNREIQNVIAVIKFTSMKHFRETLNDYFANLPTSSHQQKEHVTSKPHSNVHKFEKNYSATQRKDVRNITCYNCNEKGHMSKSCPKPQKKLRCTYCQRTNHKTEDCYTRQRNVTEKKPTINNINDSDETYNNVVKQIIINGKTATAFLDSGSPASLMRKIYAIKFDELLQNCYKHLSGFAGGTYVSTQKMLAKVVVDENEFEIEIFIVENDDIPENVLIGRDLLCKKGNRMVIEDGSCRMESTDTVQVASISEHPSSTELNEILNENRNCIANELAELGKCCVEKMEIQLTTDVPINMKPYRVAFAKREIITGIINELLDCEIIRPSKSHYASPVVLVAKKNGEHRLCVDYRCLNKITKRTPFPIPNLEEQFAQLAGNFYFTTLDLRMGYHQIEMDEKSKQFTAFVTTDGHYEYNRMPFGLVNAPGVFQRVMNTIIAKMNPGESLVYLDDVVIPSQTISEGMQRLRKLLKILCECGLTLRLEKCQFLTTEIEHLGHIVNGNGIRPGTNKISAIKNFKVPVNVTEVRRFMGLTGFFRKFVPDYSLIIKPITQLLHKTEIDNFNWGNEQQQAFEKIICILSDAPLLVLYDVTKQHEVHTDACAIGLAGVLLQSADGKNWKPVMYFSRHCTAAEQVYHSYELEVLAVVESLERFRLYLLGKSFRVVTDCAAIAQTKEQRELKPRIALWWLKLQEYDFSVVHRPGNRLAHVDALSRAPVDVAIPCEPVGNIYVVTDQQSDWIVAMQQRDERAKYIVNVLKDKVKDPDTLPIKRDFVLENERLYYKIGNEKKCYVPKAVRWNLIKHYHDNMGHFAVEKTLQRLTKWFWFPKMRKLVKAYIKSCINCCYNKSKKSKPEGELHFSEPIPIPFRMIHIDHLGPFIRSTRGNTHLLVITDAFSKFCIVKAVKNTKTGPVINALKEVISYFGLPEKIVSDRGTAFTSKVFATFCKTNNIRHIQTAVRTPRANGQVERSNATILDVLRTSTENPKHWDDEIEKLQWILNSQRNSTTKFTPNELIFNYNINDIIHNNLVAAVSSDAEVSSTVTASEKRSLAIDNIALERNKWKQRFDKTHAKPTEYCEGDLVVIRIEPAATGESRKLEPKYRGPYMISRSLGNDRYVITDVPGVQITNKAFNSVYSSDHIKPWCQSYPELVEPEDEEGEISGDEDSETSVEATVCQERPSCHV